MTKKIVLILTLNVTIFGFAQTETWFSSLDIAKRLARIQNKPILMSWEEATLYPLPVLIKDSRGKSVVIENLFSSNELNNVIWEYFIPVKVNELLYEDLYNDIKDKRSKSYISDFNDDSLKVMDANGVIIGTSGAFTELLDFTKFVSRYALNSEFLKKELENYNRDKDFYSVFYLGTKYIDYSLFTDKSIRDKILDVASIYLTDAELLLQNNENLKDKNQLTERLRFTELTQELVKGKPRRVLRELKKMDTSKTEGANKSLLSFLYYTAYRLLGDKEEFSKLESEISLVNLKQAQMIVNVNR